jgi:hypothetical protein
VTTAAAERHDDVAAALPDHGLDDEETINLAHALAAFHSQVISEDLEDWLAEAQTFGGYMFAVGLVARPWL